MTTDPGENTDSEGMDEACLVEGWVARPLAEVVKNRHRAVLTARTPKAYCLIGLLDLIGHEIS